MSIMTDPTFIGWVQTVLAAISAWIAWSALKKMDANSSANKMPKEVLLGRAGTAFAVLGAVLGSIGMHGFSTLSVFIGGVLINGSFLVKNGPIARIEVLFVAWVSMFVSIDISLYLVTRLLAPIEGITQLLKSTAQP